MENGTEVWVKSIKSVTSCDGRLVGVDLSMYYSSVNTRQNQVQLYTLKVQDDVQLEIAKFCLSIKDGFYNKGSGIENISLGLKFLDCYEFIRIPVLPFGSNIPIDSDE